MIRPLFSLGFFLLLTIPTSEAASSLTDVPLKSFEAQYHIRKAGVTVGKLTRTLKIAAKNAYRFSSHARTSGLAALFSSNETEETSTGNFSDGIILPLRYDYIRTKGSKIKSDSVRFFRDQQLLGITRRGTDSERPLTNDALDKLSYQLQLMLDLLNGDDEKLSYKLETPSKVKTYHAKKTGHEELSTSAGDYLTIRIQQINDGNKQTTFWCAEDLQYLPVKVVVSDEDGKTEILLASFGYTD